MNFFIDFFEIVKHLLIVLLTREAGILMRSTGSLSLVTKERKADKGMCVWDRRTSPQGAKLLSDYFWCLSESEARSIQLNEDERE